MLYDFTFYTFLAKKKTFYTLALFFSLIYNFGQNLKLVPYICDQLNFLKLVIIFYPHTIDLDF